MTDFSKDAKIFKAFCDTKRLIILDCLKSGEKCCLLYTSTLANVSEEQKNRVSHRGRALAKLVDFMEKEN